MNKNELVKEVSKSTEISKDEVRKVINSVIETINDTLYFGENINLEGLGSFALKKSKEKMCMNFKTGKKDILIPKRYRVAFTISPTIKNRVASKTVH